METIVLDYCSGCIAVLKHDKSEDTEKLLDDEGFNLNDCEWMTVDRIKINWK